MLYRSILQKQGLKASSIDFDDPPTTNNNISDKIFKPDPIQSDRYTNNFQRLISRT